MASITLYGMRYVPVQEYQFEDTEYSYLLPQEGWVLTEVVENDGLISHNIDGVPLVGIGKSVFENATYDLRGVEFGFASDGDSRPDPYLNDDKYGRRYSSLSDPDLYTKSKIAFIDSNAFKNYRPNMFASSMRISDFQNIAYVGRSAFDSANLMFYMDFMRGFEGKTIVFKEDAFKNCRMSSSINIYANAILENNVFNGVTFETYGLGLSISIRGQSHIGRLGFKHEGAINLYIDNIAEIYGTILEDAEFERFNINSMNEVIVNTNGHPIFTTKKGQRQIEEIDISVRKIQGELILPDNVKARELSVRVYDPVLTLSGLNDSEVESVRLELPYDYTRKNVIQNFGNYTLFQRVDSFQINSAIIEDSFNNTGFGEPDLDWIDINRVTIQRSFNYSTIRSIRDVSYIDTYGDNTVESSFFHNLNMTEDGRVGFMSDNNAPIHREGKAKHIHYNTNLKLYGDTSHVRLGNSKIDESKFTDRLYVNKQRVYPILNYGYKQSRPSITIPGEWTLENTRFARDDINFYVTVRNAEGYDDVIKINRSTYNVEKIGLAAPNWKDFALILNEDGLTFMGGIVKDEPGFKKVFQLNGSRRHVRNLNDTDQQFGQTYKVANTYYSMSAGNVYFMGDGKYSRNRITRILKGDNGNILLPQNEKVVLWHENSPEGYSFIRVGNPKNVGVAGPAKLCKVLGYGDGVHSVTVSGHQFALLTEDGRLVVGGLGDKDGTFKEIQKRVDMNSLQQIFSIDGYLCLKYTDKVMYCDMATIDSDDWHIAYDDTITIINAYGHFGLRKRGNKLDIYQLDRPEGLETDL